MFGRAHPISKSPEFLLALLFLGSSCTTPGQTSPNGPPTGTGRPGLRPAGTGTTGGGVRGCDVCLLDVRVEGFIHANTHYLDPTNLPANSYLASVEVVLDAAGTQRNTYVVNTSQPAALFTEYPPHSLHRRMQPKVGAPSYPITSTTTSVHDVIFTLMIPGSPALHTRHCAKLVGPNGAIPVTNSSCFE